MTTNVAFAALAVGAGLALIAVGLLSRVRAREEALAEILDLPFGERDVPVEAVTDSLSPIVEGAVGFAGRMVSSFDAKGQLATLLEQARVLLRPGEYVLLCLFAGVTIGAVLVGITAQWLYGLVGILLPAPGSVWFLKLRIKRRRRKFEEQLPDALTLIASSLSAGHTFLRAIQMMCEESEPPLAEEFARVVSETRLGSPVVDALQHMADRLQIRDVDWLVQAIRIQQTVGGKLADLLHTLADFMRSREELRREISVLTAEGRISAWVLGALPFFLLLAVQVISPNYMKPMYRGWGPIVLAGTAASVGVGFALILRMVKSIEV
jgi:tight adherence protein B